jgi:hypothetical protein
MTGKQLYMRIEMPDGSKWDVPAKIIAEERAKYFAAHNSGKDSGAEFDKIYNEELELAMNNKEEDYYEIRDWVSNNMNWEDLVSVAQKVENPPKRGVDYDEGVMNGDKTFLMK